MKKIITLLLVLTGMVSTASAATGYTYYVAGSNAITGSSVDWSVVAMTDAGGVSTLEVEANLTAGTTYYYKYVINDGTDYNWDYLNGSNRTFSVQADGKYKIKFEVDDAKVESYNDKYYAPEPAWGVMEPTSIKIYGQGVTSNTWGSLDADFTADGDSWIYVIDETIDNIYFHIKINGEDYSPSTNKWFNPTDGWTLNINTWSDYHNKAQSFCLSSFTALPYSRYQVKVTPFHDNLYIQVSAYEKVTTNDNGYATFVNVNPLTISGATAYGAEDSGNGNATAHIITKPVVANTPMLIKGDAGKTYYFEVASEGNALDYSNAFQAGPVSVLASESDGKYNYILNGDAFYEANGKAVASGKAYLQLSVKAAARALIFEDEDVTGINAVTAVKGDVDGYYNLQGVKVVNPTKGLYIHNGKKYLAK